MEGEIFVPSSPKEINDNYQSSPQQQKNSSPIPNQHSADGAHDINIRKNKSTCVGVTDTQTCTEAQSCGRTPPKSAPPNARYEMPINGPR